MAALIRSLSNGSEIAAAALALFGALLEALADDFRTRFPELVVVLGAVGLLLPEASLVDLGGRPTLAFVVGFRVQPFRVALGGDSTASTADFTGLGFFVEA